MTFDADFLELMSKYGRLPQVKSIEHCIQLERKNLELSKANVAYKQEAAEIKELFKHLYETEDGLKDTVEQKQTELKLEKDRLNYEKEEDDRTELEEQWELEEEEENRQVCEYQQATVGESGNTESNDFEVLQVEEVKTGAAPKVPGLNLRIVTDDRDDPDEEEMEILWQKGGELAAQAAGLMTGLKARIALSMA